MFAGSLAAGWPRIALTWTTAFSSNWLAWAYPQGRISNENIEWRLRVGTWTDFRQVIGLIQMCMRSKLYLLLRENAKTYCKCHEYKEGWTLWPLSITIQRQRLLQYPGERREWFSEELCQWRWWKLFDSEYNLKGMDSNVRMSVMEKAPNSDLSCRPSHRENQSCQLLRWGEKVRRVVWKDHQEISPPHVKFKRLNKFSVGSKLYRCHLGRGFWSSDTNLGGTAYRWHLMP